MKKSEKINMFIFLGIVGLISLVGGIIGTIKCEASLVSGFCTGFGVSLLVISIIRIIKLAKMSDAELKKEIISEKDERNIAIKGKAALMSILITTFTMVASAFLLAFTDNLIGTSIIAINLVIMGFTLVLFINFYNKRI